MTRPVKSTDPTKTAPASPTRSPSATRQSEESARARSDHFEADLRKALALIESVAGIAKQKPCVEKLVSELAVSFPGCSIRCGIGGTKIKCLYDLRLGWLGSESELFLDASQIWNEDSTSDHQGSNVRADHDLSRRIDIDQSDGLGRCSIWIAPDGVLGGSLIQTDHTLGDLRWLHQAVPTLASLLWTRNVGVLASLSRIVSDMGLTAKVYIFLAAIFTVVLLTWPVAYRVRCTAVAQPTESRLVAAPFEATLLAAHVKPGDEVSRGQTLVQLDGRPLRLELETIEAQIQQSKKEHDIALAGGRIGDAQQAKLRQRELGRKRDLIDERLRHLNVNSPISGVVIEGDLHRAIGQPLEMGQSLIEIAPMDRMTIEIEIPEYEVNFVESNSETRINLTALAGEPIAAPLTELYPAATIRDDRNVFIGRLNITNPDGRLRPGMRGEAIAYGPTRPWLWSFVRSGWERTLWWIGY